MKNGPFLTRLAYAVNGCKTAFSKEASFRTQIIAGVFTIIATAIISPSFTWWAIIALTIALVLAAELINTALESLLDGLHPQHAEFVKNAKDCAAAAVFVLSAASVAIFVLMLIDSRIR